MRICIFDNNRIKKFDLPAKVEEYYLIKYSPYKSNREYTIAIEAQEGKWVLKSNGSANVYAGNTIVSSQVLEEHNFYTLKLMNYDIDLVLYTLPSIEKETYKVAFNEQTNIVIGKSSKCHIVYNKPSIKDQHCLIKLENGVWNVYSAEGATVYLNDAIVTHSQLKTGDIIFVEGFTIIWMKKYMKINNPNKLITVKGLVPYEELEVGDISKCTPVNDGDADVDLYTDDDYFYHTPRIRNILSSREVEIDAPPAEQKGQEMPLLLTLGSSLTMSATTFVSAYTLFTTIASGESSFIEELPSVIICVAMIIGTLIMPRLISAWQKSQLKKREKLRQKKYRQYLRGKEEEINVILKEQTAILRENNPTTRECITIIENKKGELWSREITHDDFTTVRLGNGNKLASLQILAPQKKFSLEEDNLEEMVYEVTNKSKMLNEIPVTISFTSTPVISFWSNCSYKHEYVGNLILQLAALQSAADLKIVILTDSKNEHYWEYVKFLPHCWSDDKSVRFFSTNLDDAKQVSSFLEQEYKTRFSNFNKSLSAEEEKEKKAEEKFRNYPPYYIVITDNYRMVKNIPIVNMILKSATNCGFSFVTIGSAMKDLPSECNDFVQLGEVESCILSKDVSYDSQIHFRNEFEQLVDMKRLSVMLSNIPIVTKAGMSSLPQMLTFLEMYEVSKIEQLNISNKWQTNNPVTSLSVPIGVHEDGELFKLDLHEKFHGPHGLIAGMTGSGKSEFIITYILSLACNFHPYEVQFVLIDYKGGGLAGAFENKETGVRIPHLAGTITNLDTAEMNRTLVSIQSELKRRQRKFNEVKDQLGESTVDIYKYQKFYREGLIKEPMAHLFIISDEFAELKAQQPDFLDELVSAARIGRSLGVHLILATQKPSGVVNDQIWSNSKFKVCLKVQDSSDSSEMLRRPDAASIKETGRFYLQVGYDDYFDIGQSAWGGAKYVPSDIIHKKVDDSLSFVNNIGFVTKTVNEMVKKEDDATDIGDQLTNIVKYIYNLGVKENLVRNQLWLDAIPEKIFLEDIKKKYNYRPTQYSINPVIGEYDNPKAQEQGILNLMITGENTIIYGEGGSGKENLLTTILYSSMIEHTPDEVSFYIVDCGAEVLKMFYKMPHVGEIATVDEEDKISEIFAMATDELEKRKDLFADYAGSYQNYIENSGQKLPIITIIINNYDIFEEVHSRMADNLNALYRDGAKYGISFIVSCVTTNAMMGRTKQYFGNKLTLRLPNPDSYSDVVNSSRGQVPAKFFGRGLVDREDCAYEFQTAYIYEPKDINKLIQSASMQLNNYYTSRAAKIKSVPKVVVPSMILNEVKGLDHVPLGYDMFSKDIFNYNFINNKINIISSENITKDEGFINVLLKEFSSIESVNLKVIDFLEAFKTDLPIEILNTNFDKTMGIINNEVVEEKNSEKINLYVIIGAGRMSAKLTEKGRKIASSVFNAASTLTKTFFILIDNYNAMKGLSLENWYQSSVNSSSGIWIGPGIDSQMLINVGNMSYDERSIEFPNMAFAVNNGEYFVLKHVIDSAEGENEK